MVRVSGEHVERSERQLCLCDAQPWPHELEPAVSGERRSLVAVRLALGDQLEEAQRIREVEPAELAPAASASNSFPCSTAQRSE